MASANRFEWKRDLAKIGKPVDRNDWRMTPPTVNAHYNSAKNEIVFPAGILQPPFFYAEGDDAINYGAIGGVIGHEITHGFDDSGRKFDAKGNQVDWWTEADGKTFDERREVHRSSSSTATSSSRTSTRTASSCRARRSRTSAARRSRTARSRRASRASPRRRRSTASRRTSGSSSPGRGSGPRTTGPSSRGCMAQTNEHPLGKFRAIGTIVNMPEFAKAFGCGAGTAMVREARCEIW